MLRTIRAGLVAGMLVISAAACGGDDDADSASTEAPAAESGDDAGIAETAPAADTEAPVMEDTVATEESATEDTTTDEEASEQVAGIGVDAAFCAKLDEVGKAGEALFEGTDLSNIEEQADEAVDLIRGLVDDAPDELKADLETTADAFEKIAPLMGEMAQLLEDPTNPENQARMEELGALFEGEIAAEADAASQRIGAYARDKCGLED